MDLVPEILVVDDDPDIRETVREVLRDEGYKVTTAQNGKEAMRRLEDATTLPDLILLDLMMPEMNGEQFQEKKMTIPRLAEVPVVILSASVSIDEAGKLGASDVIGKPVSLDDLLTIVARFVRGSRRTAEQRS